MTNLDENNPRAAKIVEDILDSITTLTWHQIRLRYEVTLQNIRTAPEIMVLVLASQLRFRRDGVREWVTYENNSPAQNTELIELLIAELYPDDTVDEVALQEADKSPE